MSTHHPTLAEFLIVNKTVINSLRYPEFTVEFWFSRVSISEVKVTFLRGEVCSTVRVAATGVVILVKTTCVP